VVGDLEHYRVMGQDPLSHKGGTSTIESQGKGNVLVQGAGKAGGRGSSYFLIPPLVMEVTLQTLRSLGVDLMVCDGEADGLVAQLAMERSMNENVVEAYAVSKDSGKGTTVQKCALLQKVPLGKDDIHHPNFNLCLVVRLLYL